MPRPTCSQCGNSNAVKVSHVYESGTTSVETTGSSVGAAIGSQSISPVVMGHQATSTSTTLLASRLAPPKVDREKERGKQLVTGLWMLGAGVVFAIICSASLQSSRNSMFISGQTDGMVALVFLAAVGVAIVGLIMVGHAGLTTSDAINEDMKGRQELARWQTLWLCNGCGHTFEWTPKPEAAD